MLSLSSYIKDHTKSFTVGGTVSKKILIFDLDDTVIHTSANIRVMKGEKLMRTLSNKEYNTYILKPGEYFDYQEFNDSDILSKETFTRYWSTLKREYRKGTHISILTARNDSDMIRSFFLKNGIDIKPSLVFAINDPKLHLSGTVQERKAEVIGFLHKLGYDIAVFFDDDEENLKAAKKLEELIKIKIHIIKT